MDLAAHYERDFPCEDIFRFSGGTCFREFCVSPPWNRYISVKSAKHLREILVTREPKVLHIGPVYNMVLPASGMRDLIWKRELIFDLDLVDYDKCDSCDKECKTTERCKEAIRSCGCSAKLACRNCWIYAMVGLRILDYILRNVFGFCHILYVFSGGRGFHCWVCDERACLLSKDERIAIVSHIGSYKELMRTAPVQASNIPLLGKIYYDVLSRSIPNPEDWLRSIYTSFMRFSRPMGEKIAVLYLLWPRLDKNVSTSLNHALKSPYCIHPRTNRICHVIEAWKTDTPESIFDVPLNYGENLVTFKNFVDTLYSRKAIE